MKIGLYGSIDNGPVRDLTIPYVAVDGGLYHLLNQKIKPILAIGDYDSLEDKSLLTSLKSIQLPVMKDETDLEAAILEVINLGYDEIDIYGVTGKRLDHFFAAIRILVKYRSYSLTIYDELNKITLLKPGIHQIKKDDYQYLSFFSKEEAMISLENVLYPLNNYCLKYDDPLCVSNEILTEAIVTNNHDIYMIQSKDKV